MTPPTLPDWDRLFSAFDNKETTEALNKQAWSLCKTAKDSKAFLTVLEGWFRATLSGVTLAGLQISPVAMTFLIGFVMGSQWAERQTSAPAEDDSAIIASYLKELEKLEGRKGTDDVEKHETD